MPAIRLGRSPVTVNKYDVVGTDAATGPSEFVGHLSMAGLDSQSIAYGSNVSVTHMLPPFNEHEEMNAHVMGSASLSQEEAKLIGVFLFEVSDEYKACGNKMTATDQYVAYPHVAEVKDQIDGMLLFHRFSCAGLVVEAYRYARVDLVKTE